MIQRDAKQENEACAAGVTPLDRALATKTRTKRRYAHELYPHAKRDEVRPLSVEVPYLYAQAIGFNVCGTGWTADEAKPLVQPRFVILCMARERALLADAALQGLHGDEAWRWVHEHLDEGGEMVWDRAVANGVDPNKIKPYKCGPEPDDHMCGAGLSEGWRVGAPGREDECPHCSEPDETGGST